MILTLDQKLPEAKVIIHRSRGEVLEQDTIECVSIVYLKFVFQFMFFFYLKSRQLFSADTTVSKKNLPPKNEKTALKSI